MFMRPPYLLMVRTNKTVLPMRLATRNCGCGECGEPAAGPELLFTVFCCSVVSWPRWNQGRRQGDDRANAPANIENVRAAL